jgi:hypothetical protein
MRWYRLALLLLAALSGGCVALRSELNDQGMVYHLPKSILSIAIWEHFDQDTGRVWYHLGGVKEGAPAEGDASNLTDEIKPTTIPDPRHRYVIKYRPSPFSDDRLCLSRSPSGLLHDVQFAADDRTPQVVFNVARFISGAVGAAKPAYFVEERSKEPGKGIRRRAYSARVDPFEDDDIEAFNQALRNVFRAPLRVDFHRMREIVEPSKRAWPKGCDRHGCSKHAWEQVCAPEHICYRTKLKLPIDLYLGKSQIDIKYAEMINAWDIGAISVTRAFLVHKITKLRFQEGALVAAVIRKPSEIEELSLLPIHVLNAALITPSGLWAAAFSANNALAGPLINQMATLTTNVQNLETALRQVAPDAGVTGANIPGAGESYNLDCRAPGRGQSINLLNPGANKEDN